MRARAALVPAATRSWWRRARRLRRSRTGTVSSAAPCHPRFPSGHKDNESGPFHIHLGPHIDRRHPSNRIRQGRVGHGRRRHPYPMWACPCPISYSSSPVSHNFTSWSSGPAKMPDMGKTGHGTRTPPRLAKI